MKELIFKNGIWLFIKNISSQIIKTFSKLILARLLVPEDFGIVALLVMILDLLAFLGAFGTSSYIIREKKYKESDVIFHVFSLSLIFNLLFLAIIWIFNPVIVSFFNKPMLALLLKSCGIFLILSPLYNITTALLEKRMQFKLVFFAEFVGLIFYASIAIGLAYLKFSYWSLILAHYFSLFINIVFLCVFSKIRFKFQKFNIGLVKNMINFSKYILGHSLIILGRGQYDKLVIAKFLPAGDLAFYIWAFTIAILPVQIGSHVINTVMYPIYCKFQDNKSEIFRILFKLLRIFIIIGGPFFIFIGIFSHDLIKLVLGHKWLLVAYPLSILCIYGFLRCILAISGSVFNAIGRANIIFNISILNICVFAIILPILVNYHGIIGASWGVTICMVIDAFFVVIFFLKIFKNDMFLDICIIRPILAGLLLGVWLILCKKIFLFNNFVNISIALFFYLTYLFLFEKDITKIFIDILFSLRLFKFLKFDYLK